MFTPRRIVIAAIALLLAGPAVRAAEPDMLPLPHRGAVLTCAFSPDGKFVATGGADKSVRIWELASGRETRRLEAGDKVVHVAYAPDARSLVIVAAGGDAPIQLWDAGTGKVIWKATAGAGTLTSAAFSPDGRRLAAGSNDQSLYVLDAPTGRMLMNARGHLGGVTAVAVSPDGRLIASGGADYAVCLWDMPTGRQLLRLMAHSKEVESVAFSPDGKLLASAASRDKGVRLWDVATGKKVRQLEAPDAVHCVAFAPDGKTIAVAGADKLVRLFEAATGKETRSFGGLQGKITGLAFSPDARRVVTAGEDGTAIVWDLTKDEKPLPKDLKLTTRELDALWADLAGDDGRKAYAALRTLRAAPADAVPFLRDQLKPRPATGDEKKITSLIADLDSDSFDVRERTSQDLAQLGKPAEKALRQALAAGPSAEMKLRLEKLLDKLGGDGALSAEQNRDLRAVRILEGVGTADARKVLEGLVRDSPGWWVTKEAKGALERLGKEK